MTEALFTFAYALLFVFIIYKHSFFHLQGISKKITISIFILKILCGLVLWWIYTYYYTDRIKADIYKYYDDSKPLYDLLFQHPIDFFQILFGINNDTEKYNYIYDQMYNWYTPFATHIYNSNQAIIRINTAIRILSFGNFNVHTVFFCFFSLIGQVAIYKTFYPYLENKKWGLCIAVFLLPTVLFWGSGVLKEGIILFGLGLFIYSFHELIFRKINFKTVIILLTGIVSIGIMKPYILISLFPGSIILIVVRYFGNRFLLLKYAGILIVMILIGCALARISDNYNAPQMLSFRQKDFYNAMKGGIYFQRYTGESKDYENIYFPASKLKEFKNVVRGDTIQINFTDTAYIWDVMTYLITDTILITPSANLKYRLVMKDTISGSGIKIPELKASYLSIIKNSPMAFLNSLSRPYPFEMDSIFSLMAGFENILLELFMIFCLFFIKIPTDEKRTMALFSFSFVLMLFILTGLVTPVIGAIVRYKMPALPFLIISLLLITDTNKLK